MRIRATALICLTVLLSLIATSLASPNTARQAGFEAQISEIKTSLEALSIRETQTREYLADLSLMSPPVGSIVPFAGEWPPKKNGSQSRTEEELGWMLCDGRSVPRAQYMELSWVIRSAWGGDETHLNLPDLRGLFLRGVDDSPNLDSNGVKILPSGRDPESGERHSGNSGGNSKNMVGSLQDDDFTRHDHDIGPPGRATAVLYNEVLGVGRDQDLLGTHDAKNGLVTVIGKTGKTPAENSGKETRPKNASVYWIIKVKSNPRRN